MAIHLTLSFAAFQSIVPTLNQFVLFDSDESGNVRVAVSARVGKFNDDLVCQILPKVGVSEFINEYKAAVAVQEISMALINASEAATAVSATIPNSTEFTVQQETVTTAATPVQAAALAVLTDRAVTIQNDPTNAGNAILYVANSSANALLTTARVQLSRSQSLVLNIDNLDKIWLNSNINGVKATLVVEA